MSEQATEEVSPAPVIAAAVEVSEHQETRDTANAAVQDAEIAQATAAMAGEAASEASEDAAIATEVAVASAGIGAEAAVSAEEAKQEAGQALSEVGQLRQDLFSKLDEMISVLRPAEPEVPESGVTEVILDGSDIGESGLESAERSGTPVSDNNAGSSAPDNSGTSTGSRSRGFKRGRR